MNIRSALTPLAAAAASVLLMAHPASASVTFDPETGMGFVGKGDVQLAYGWNNAALQSNAAGVTFESASTTLYDATCVWTTETGGRNSKVITHIVTNTKTSSVSSALNGEVRQGKHQFTGFNLLGLGETTTTGQAVPGVGDGCVPADDMGVRDGQITAVTISQDSNSVLYAVSGGVKKAL